MMCSDLNAEAGRIRQLVLESAKSQEHPFVVALDDVSGGHILGNLGSDADGSSVETTGSSNNSHNNATYPTLAAFLKEHNKLDLPINLSILNGRSRTIRDLHIKYMPMQDPLLQKIYEHSGSSVNWFRKPYGKVYLVTCENTTEYKKKIRPRLKELIEQREKNINGGGNAMYNAVTQNSGDLSNSNLNLLARTPWLILYLHGPSPTPQAQQQHKKVFQSIKDEFNSSKYNTMYDNPAGSRSGVAGQLGGLSPHVNINSIAQSLGSGGLNKSKGDRVCQLVLGPGGEWTGWEELSKVLGECVKKSFECKLSAYLCEVRNLALLRRTPGWSFDHFFLVKGSLAHMFEQAHVYDEAMREYYELEVIYTDTLEAKKTEGASAELFGDQKVEDNEASILYPSRKNLRQLCKHPEPDQKTGGSLKEFDVWQYLFAKRALLMLKEIWAAEKASSPSSNINKMKSELAKLGQQFISSFTRKLQKNNFNSKFIDIWVFTACMQMASALTMQEVHQLGEDGSSSSKEVLENHSDNRVFNGILADLYIYCHSKLLKLGVKESFSTKRSNIRHRVSKSIILPSPKLHRTESADQKLEQTLDTFEDPGDSFEEELILMETEAAVVAARNAAVAAESAMHDALQDKNASDTRSGEDEYGGKLACLRDKDTYNLYVLSLAREAANKCRLCGRERQAVQLEANNVDILIHKGEVSQARKLLEQQCKVYFEDGWLHLLADHALPQLIECQTKLKDRHGLLSSMAKLLTMDDQLRRESKLDEESIQSALSRLYDSSVQQNLGGEVGPEEVNLHKSVNFRRYSGSFSVDNQDNGQETGFFQSPWPVVVCQNDVAILPFEVTSHFPFPLQISNGSLTFQQLKRSSKKAGGAEGGDSTSQCDTITTKWIHVFRDCDKEEILKFADRIRTSNLMQLFGELGDECVLFPGSNLMFAAVECSQLGVYFPQKYSGKVYGCNFFSQFLHFPCSEENGLCQYNYSTLHDSLDKRSMNRLEIVDEMDRLIVSSITLNEKNLFMLDYQLVGMCIIPLHDMLYDCKVKVNISRDKKHYLDVSDAWVVIRKRDSSPDGADEDALVTHKLKMDKDNWFTLPARASSDTTFVWLTVQNNQSTMFEDVPKVHFIPLSTVDTLESTQENSNTALEERRPDTLVDLDFDYEVCYTSGRVRSFTGNKSITAISPFRTQVTGRSISDTVVVVEIKLHSNLPWKIQIDKCTLKTQENYKIVKDVCHNHDLFPFVINSTYNACHLVYFLEVLEGGQDKVVPGEKRESGKEEEEWKNLSELVSTLHVNFTSTGYPQDSFVHNKKCIELLSNSFTETLMDEACMLKDSHEYMFNFNLLDPLQRNGSKSLINVMLSKLPETGHLRLLQASPFEWRVTVTSRQLSSLQLDTVKNVVSFPYEIRYSREHWMLAGQNKGYAKVHLDESEDEYECLVQIDCIPLACGSLPCPQMQLTGEAANYCLMLPSASKVIVKPNRTVNVNLD